MPRVGAVARRIPWLLMNTSPRPYSAVALLRAAISRRPPPGALRALVMLEEYGTMWRVRGQFPADCCIDMTVCWVPSPLNQLDAAMMRATRAAFIRVRRTVRLHWPNELSRPTLVIRFAPWGSDRCQMRSPVLQKLSGSS